ncbi:hypothetical protein [Candidatus Thioglobus autotrophicus]|nr:hypothetical protein [Candidatus Thioglobus autotrophicus]WPE16345.1 hypothetical protein R5P06_07280 [Candidatus Thioglobus autotrophicus]WPE17892.1 hypothetical protein R5P05_07435 [Candidatus Thioglobus autotrophicus]
MIRKKEMACKGDNDVFFSNEDYGGPRVDSAFNELTPDSRVRLG